jgi:LytS/YehU family sensor histidine kinase
MIFAPVLVGLFGLSDIFVRFRVTVGGNTADIGPKAFSDIECGRVEDNGRGITTEAETREGFGFVNMRARVKKLKGALEIRTAPGRGTAIVVSVPLNAGS